jgi:cleavage and polyadenylation specificity factor subunit 1
MTTANLSTSEHKNSRKHFLCVGTLTVLGEDQASRGNILVLNVINIIPEPGKPETGHKLKAYAKEDVKGAVTALAEIGPEGFLLVAQGQKAMVRGLVEAEKLVPVAFMDIQCFVTSAKVLKGTSMMALGDVAKGVWFAGYTVSVFGRGLSVKTDEHQEEPWSMQLFGRTGNIEVTATEFLPYEKSLYILVADADKNVHVMQYDPESKMPLS